MPIETEIAGPEINGRMRGRVRQMVAKQRV